jgi:hypothetical protein
LKLFQLDALSLCCKQNRGVDCFEWAQKKF